MDPACAPACPTQSIQFGNLSELRERADRRVAQLHDLGGANIIGSQNEVGKVRSVGCRPHCEQEST